MSDEPKKPDAPAAGQPAIPEAPGAAAAPPADEQVEYVYEDENGNPVAAPEAAMRPGEDYEEVVVEAAQEETGKAPDAPAAAQQALPEAPGAAASPSAAEEVEYVYEDEHGNRLEAPGGGFNAEEYEVVAAEPAAVAAPAEKPADATGATKRLKPVSSRRSGERKSGRQSRPMTPEELKKVRVKVFLLLGLLSLIPILTAAIFIVRYHKNKKRPVPQQRRVPNEFEQGKQLSEAAYQRYKSALALCDQGKDEAAEPTLAKCKEDFTLARELILRCRRQRPGDDYAYMDQEAAQIWPWLRTVNDKLEMLRARRERQSAPPAPPASLPDPPGG